MRLSTARERAQPTREDVARLAGLCDLRVGKHFLRDEQKQPVGCVWVRWFWIAEVVPSFQPPLVLALIKARGEKYGDRVSPDWVKAVFATPQEAAIAELDADPIAEALGSFHLCHLDDNPCPEGLAYTFAFETPQLAGTLQFGKPVQPSLRALQGAMVALARTVAEQSGRAALREAADAWRELAEGPC